MQKNKSKWIVIGVLLILVIALGVGIAVFNSKDNKQTDNELGETTGLIGAEETDDTEDEVLNPDASQTDQELNKEEQSDKETTEGNQTEEGTTEDDNSTAPSTDGFGQLR